MCVRVCVRIGIGFLSRAAERSRAGTDEGSGQQRGSSGSGSKGDRRGEREREEREGRGGRAGEGERGAGAEGLFFVSARPPEVFLGGVG